MECPHLKAAWAKHSAAMPLPQSLTQTCTVSVSGWTWPKPRPPPCATASIPASPAAGTVFIQRSSGYVDLLPTESNEKAPTIFQDRRRSLVAVNYPHSKHAEEGTRTPTPLRALRPEHSVYTISPLRHEHPGRLRRNECYSTRSFRHCQDAGEFTGHEIGGAVSNFRLSLRTTRARRTRHLSRCLCPN